MSINVMTSINSKLYWVGLKGALPEDELINISLKKY